MIRGTDGNGGEYSLVPGEAGCGEVIGEFLCTRE